MASDQDRHHPGAEGEQSSCGVPGSPTRAKLGPTCPITLDTIVSPVTTRCGHVFEHEALLNWYQKADTSHGTRSQMFGVRCPSCRQELLPTVEAETGVSLPKPPQLRPQNPQSRHERAQQQLTSDSQKSSSRQGKSHCQARNPSRFKASAGKVATSYHDVHRIIGKQNKRSQYNQ